MAAILVQYATQEGQTKTIADFIGEVLKDEGHIVAVASAEYPPVLTSFDAIMLGASVHIGHYPKVFLDYVKAHHGSLNKMQSAFYSVCISANKDDPEHQQKAQGFIDMLARESRWQPHISTSFAGALKFTQYGFFKKQVMKTIAKREHLKVDGQHDYEYTDWERVTRFALEFSTIVKEASRTSVPLKSLPHPSDKNIA